MSAPAHQSEDKLLEFAYGELPAPEAEAVEAHVRGCARCAESLDGIKHVRSTMARLAPEPAPDAGLESLLAYAEQAARRNAEVARPKPWWSRFIVPVASVTALALVGVVFVKTQFELDPVKAAVDAKHEVMKQEAVAKEKQKDRAVAEGEQRKAAQLAQEAAQTPPAAPAAAQPPPPDEKTGTYASGELPKGNAEQHQAAPQATAPRDDSAKAEPKPAPMWKGKGGRADLPTESKKLLDTRRPLANERLEADGDRAAAADKLDAPPAKADVKAEESRASDFASLSKRAGPASKKKSAPATKNEPLREDWSNAGRMAQLNDGTGVAQSGFEGTANKGMLSGSGSGGLGALGTAPAKSSPFGVSSGSGLGAGSTGTLGGGGSQGSTGELARKGSFGLGSSAAGSSVAPPPPPAADPAPMPKAQAAAKPQAKAPSVKPAEPAPVTTVIAPPVAAAAPQEAPRSSLSMNLGTRGGGKRGASSSFDTGDDEAQSVEREIDQHAATKDAEASDRRQQKRIRDELEKARQTIGAGSRATGVQIAVRVLQLGPTGGARLEALTLVCETYEAMGDSERAAPYCDLIAREFPDSAAARQVAERARANSARAKAQRQYDEAPAPTQKALPAKKAASEAAPASAY